MGYEIYDPDGRAPAPRRAGEPVVGQPGADGPWRVVIEFTGPGDAKPPTKLQFGRRTFQDRDEALSVALGAAWEFDPPDPWNPRRREVFGDGPDGFLVVIEGASSKTFHMSVRLVRPLRQP
ncbi:hypothetical protein E8D34_02730 [Nocardioides sp. GY 10113]|uniref:hypothetical protein n=1 Tax=Nocardioides sp. GY 10113 TaxID=2569761 RepID=UPI0010A7864F|nr:hypothetical protein [Nocardioides sp. GY 10113]TIC88614.1 hypothetical protein E8D34_02730 [Nocardioides sp. GY 10113]